jgi:hypothetical protein
MISLCLVGRDNPVLTIIAVDRNVCPLASLKMFISKTDPNAKSLFNRCIKDLNVNDAVWYTCQPLAKRTYSGFMTDLYEHQKSSGLIDGETLDLVIQNVWLD